MCLLDGVTSDRIYTCISIYNMSINPYAYELKVNFSQLIGVERSIIQENIVKMQLSYSP